MFWGILFPPEIIFISGIKASESTGVVLEINIISGANNAPENPEILVPEPRNPSSRTWESQSQNLEIPVPEPGNQVPEPGKPGPRDHFAQLPSPSPRAGHQQV